MKATGTAEQARARATDHDVPIIGWAVIERKGHSRDYQVVPLGPTTVEKLEQGDQVLGVLPAAPGTFGTYRQNPEDEEEAAELVALNFEYGKTRIEIPIPI